MSVSLASPSSGMVTPLQPREFFRGCWCGEGELVPRPLLRPWVRRERIRLISEAHWLSHTIWLVKDRMEFASGWVHDRKMFAELVAPDRIHVTADDMPLGADILSCLGLLPRAAVSDALHRRLRAGRRWKDSRHDPYALLWFPGGNYVHWSH